jgi:hypothetical protein
MNFVMALTSSAFLLAMWVDAKLEKRRPESPGWRVAHVAAACVLLQIAAFAGGHVIPIVAVFALLLPALVYTFVGGLWLIRTLAEVAVARR